MSNILKGYRITDIYENMEAVIKLVENSHYKKKEAKAQAIKEFEAEMAKLNLSRYIRSK